MTTLSNEAVRELVADACRAPSVHNTQPWLWTWRDGVLELRADRKRQLRHSDPEGRSLVISCGAALRLLQVAAAARGWAATVSRSAGRDPTGPLASITFTPRMPSVAERQLGAAIRARRTDRRHHSSWPVATSQIDVLRERAETLGVIATPAVEDFMTHRLASLLAEADRIHGQDDLYLDELRQWTLTDGDDGIPAGSLLNPVGPGGTPTGATRFPLGELEDATEDAAADSWLLLSTSSDDVLSWLRTGEALAAVWLECAALGISAVPHTQVIELDQTRRAVQSDLLDDTSCPQMVISLGWPTMDREAVTPTSRRPVDEVLTVL